MRKKICCRCLSESKTGYGNFNRCVILAEYLKKNLIDTIFLIDNDRNVVAELKKRKFKYSVIPQIVKKNNENLFISEFMTKKKLSTILLDMRQYGESLSKQLKKDEKKVILIDDIWSKKIYSDLFFNTTNSKTSKNYKKINHFAQIFFGLKYWPIDKNFLKYRKKINDIKDKNFLNLIISMGGSDPNNLTHDILKIVRDVDGINISVIIGPMYNNYSKLKTLIQKRKNIHFIKSPNNLFKELAKADIAITNGGNTLFELIALRVPTISIPAFKHEIAYAKKFSDQHCIINLGLKQKNKKTICTALSKMINDTKFRQNLHKSTSRKIDGNGLLRISHIISKFLQ